MNVHPHSSSPVLPTLHTTVNGENGKTTCWISHPDGDYKSEVFESAQAAVEAWNALHPASVVVATASNQ